MTMRITAGAMALLTVAAGCGDQIRVNVDAPDAGVAEEDGATTVVMHDAGADDVTSTEAAAPIAEEGGVTDAAAVEAGVDACEPLPETEATMAPELDGGLAWLNVDDPLRLEDLRGYVVMLDFWTYGCINCLHQMPVLREIEDALEDEPFVLIGVHSAKFFSEREAQNINLAMQQ
jgi:thiol-disulfide isomerase/thioredoxin